MELILCAPNFSEGRREQVVSAIVGAIEASSRIRVLNWSSDPDHNRMVVSFIGTPPAVRRAMLAAARVAIAEIDLNRHAGVHPRIGALDVVPLVPLKGITMADCAVAARELGVLLHRRLKLPIYFYEESALEPRRRALPDIRRGGFEALALKMSDPAWRPDLGNAPHPTAGAVVVGARGPLVAFNVDLDSADPALARRIAQAVREKDGGLPGVRALGLFLPNRGRAQVSLNLTRPLEMGPAQVLARIKELAAQNGCGVHGCELVGLMPLPVALEAARRQLEMADFPIDRVLESHLVDKVSLPLAYGPGGHGEEMG